MAKVALMMPDQPDDENLSLEQHAEGIKEGLNKARTGFEEAAYHLARYEAKGGDVSKLSLTRNMVAALRRLAEGRILAGAVNKWLIYQPLLLNHVSRLSLAEQKKIVDDEPLKLITIEGGQATHRMIAYSEMTDPERKQVLAYDHIRSEGEQITWLREQATPEPKPPLEIGPCRIDVERKIVDCFKRGSLTKDDIRKIWRMLND